VDTLTLTVLADGTALLVGDHNDLEAGTAEIYHP